MTHLHMPLQLGNNNINLFLSSHSSKIVNGPLQNIVIFLRVLLLTTSDFYEIANEENQGIKSEVSQCYSLSVLLVALLL